MTPSVTAAQEPEEHQQETQHELAELIDTAEACSLVGHAVATSMLCWFVFSQ